MFLKMELPHEFYFELIGDLRESVNLRSSA